MADVDRRAAVVLAAGLAVGVAGGQEPRAAAGASAQLKKFTVTVRRFDPAKGAAGGEEFDLPVDSVDAEHAASAALSNVVAFTAKLRGAEALPVAFACTGVRERR